MENILIKGAVIHALFGEEIVREGIFHDAF
jgi:hypothetical protein